VRMGLYSGFLIPIPTLILPLKGRKLVFNRGSTDACCITYADVNNSDCGTNRFFSACSESPLQAYRTLFSR